MGGNVSWNPRAWDWSSTDWSSNMNDSNAQKKTDAETKIRNDNAKAISDAKAAEESVVNQASASVTDKKRAIARSRSVYTSPLGMSDQATTAKKTLLGA